VLRGDTQLLVVVCMYTGVRWSTAWLETGEDSCRWTVRWREAELGTRAYDHAAVKGGRAGATGCRARPWRPLLAPSLEGLWWATAALSCHGKLGS